MSRTFNDEELQTWEAFATGGRFGLAVRAKVVFQCVSDQARPVRFVEVVGDEADAEALVHDSREDRLRQLLRESKILE